MASKTLLKTLDQTLIRGETVKIAQSASPDLAGVTTTVKSKKPVPCNKKGRCAGDWCVGKAIFVVDPNVEPDEDAGWRHGAAKVCLTHVLDRNGDPVLPSPAVRKAKAQKTVETSEETQETEVEAEDETEEPRVTPEINPQGPTVTWQQLAHASASLSPDEPLVTMARQLKSENEILVRRLIDAQSRLLTALEGR